MGRIFDEIERKRKNQKSQKIEKNPFFQYFEGNLKKSKIKLKRIFGGMSIFREIAKFRYFERIVNFSIFGKNGENRESAEGVVG